MVLFAKQILCAAVANSEDELDNMYLLRREQPYAECMHIEPSLASFVSSSHVTEEVVHTTTVELQQVGFFNEVVGRVGKCHKCGKIYYWIPDPTDLYIRRERRHYETNRGKTVR